MVDRVLPSREAALYPTEDDNDDYNQWLDEVALPIVAEWASGRLVDRKAIDYEAAARSRYDARFGNGAYDGENIGSHTRAFILNSATRDVDAALGSSDGC